MGTVCTKATPAEAPMPGTAVPDPTNVKQAPTKASMGDSQPISQKPSAADEAEDNKNVAPKQKTDDKQPVQEPNAQPHDSITLDDHTTGADTKLELLTPVTLGGIGQLKNRVVMSAMTRARADNEDLVPNELMKEYYVQRKSVGMILTEGTHVSKRGTGWVDVPGIYTDKQVEGWKPIVEAVQADGGSKMVLQLWHQGRQSHETLSPDVVAPSAIAASGEVHIRGDKVPNPTPRALETEQVAEIVEEFRHAAAMAKKAGFSGVEIHGANGYIVDQFLQAKSNQRTDKYGGSVEKRNQFLVELIEAILQEWPANQVGIKLSPNGVYGDMGSEDYLEQFDLAIKTAAQHKLAFVEIMDGMSFGFHELGEPYTLERAMNVIKAAQPDERVTSVLGNAGHTKDSAEKAVRAGHADAISFGHTMIANPDMVGRFANDYPLHADSDRKTWMSYGFGAEGYTTFVEYDPNEEATDNSAPEQSSE